MQIRPATAADFDQLADVDGTIESTRYLPLERAGEALSLTWKLDERPLRQKLIDPNALDDDRRFMVKQILTGADEGYALVAEHDDVIVAALVQTRVGVELYWDPEYRRRVASGELDGATKPASAAPEAPAVQQPRAAL